MTLFKICLQNFYSSRNMALVIGATYTVQTWRNYQKIKPLVRFQNNFTDMFLGWPFWKFLPEISIPQETWLWWRGLLALYGNEEKNSSSLKSLINFKIVSQKYSLRDPFQKLFTKLLSVYSHGSGCEDFLHYREIRRISYFFFTETAGQILK